MHIDKDKKPPDLVNLFFLSFDGASFALNIAFPLTMWVYHPTMVLPLNQTNVVTSGLLVLPIKPLS